MPRWHRSICLAFVLLPAIAAAQAPPRPAAGRPVRIAHHCGVDLVDAIRARPRIV